MVRCPRRPAGRLGAPTRPRARRGAARCAAGACTPARVAMEPCRHHLVPEHRAGGRAAPLPRRPSDRAAAVGHRAMERAGHGGAGQRRAGRTGRPHRQLCLGSGPVRGGLPPFLSCTHRAARRRPGVLPAALGARRLCPRIPRRPAERRLPAPLPPGTGRKGQGHPGPDVLSTPLPHAGFLAVSHRLDGHRPHQGHLPGALHALSGRPGPVRHGRPQGLGLLRRRRDGRARIHRRAHPRRARGAGQLHLRDQLQPAAAGRPGARQRPHRG